MQLLNSLRYRNMITEFLWPQVEGMDLDDMWFQQDGLIYHNVSQKANDNSPPRL